MLAMLPSVPGPWQIKSGNRSDRDYRNKKAVSEIGQKAVIAPVTAAFHSEKLKRLSTFVGTAGQSVCPGLWKLGCWGKGFPG